MPCRASDKFRTVEAVEFYDDTLGVSVTDETFQNETPELMVNDPGHEVYLDEAGLEDLPGGQVKQQSISAPLATLFLIIISFLRLRRNTR